MQVQVQAPAITSSQLSQSILKIKEKEVPKVISMKYDEIQKKLINTKVDSIVDNILVNGDSETKNSLIKMLVEKIKSTEIDYNDVRMKALKLKVNSNPIYPNNQQTHDLNDDSLEKLKSISNGDVKNILRLNLNSNNVISKHNLIESYRHSDMLSSMDRFDVNTEMKEANKLLSKSDIMNTNTSTSASASTSGSPTNDLIENAQK